MKKTIILYGLSLAVLVFVLKFFEYRFFVPFMYAVSWEITYNTIMKGDFMQQYAHHYETKMKDNGATATELAEAKQRMESLAVMYRNPVIRFGMTLLEVAPVGIIVSLLSAALFRQKKSFPIQILNTSKYLHHSME